MAKTTIAGNSLVITSSVPMATWKTVEKLRPQSMILFGGKTGEEALFRAATGEPGEGKVTKYGVVFDGETYDDRGLATVTVAGFCPEGDPRQAVYEQFGSILSLLGKLEESLGGVMDEINAEKATIMGSINFAQ